MPDLACHRADPVQDSTVGDHRAPDSGADCHTESSVGACRRAEAVLGKRERLRVVDHAHRQPGGTGDGGTDRDTTPAAGQVRQVTGDPGLHVDLTRNPYADPGDVDSRVLRQQRSHTVDHALDHGVMPVRATSRHGHARGDPIITSEEGELEIRPSQIDSNRAGLGSHDSNTGFMFIPRYSRALSHHPSPRCSDCLAKISCLAALPRLSKG
ncbi:MAG: hypothetical protein K0R44_2112 [Thermomicrobiales bacterium]|nr:hypothetical protein [Thermomicrobiales bacterium]